MRPIGHCGGMQVYGLRKDLKDVPLAVRPPCIGGGKATAVPVNGFLLDMLRHGFKLGPSSS